jgi:hypothetical protein
MWLSLYSSIPIDSDNERFRKPCEVSIHRAAPVSQYMTGFQGDGFLAIPEAVPF